jgi:hypothetical protein
MRAGIFYGKLSKNTVIAEIGKFGIAAKLGRPGCGK